MYKNVYCQSKQKLKCANILQLVNQIYFSCFLLIEDTFLCNLYSVLGMTRAGAKSFEKLHLPQRSRSGAKMSVCNGDIESDGKSHLRSDVQRENTALCEEAW